MDDRPILLNKEQIKEIIPHREPFLLVDEVLEMEEGQRIVAIKHVKESEYYFEGHFPMEKVMPGVLQIEALAQAGAVAVLSMPEHRGKMVYFGGIKDAKFRQKVLPGDRLVLEVALCRMRSRSGVGSAEAHVGGKLACKCEIMFMMD